MRENALIDKSIVFAARIIKLHKYLLRSKKETIISKQIVRSGTSIGANINEANYGQSKADFVAKLQIALKECSESEYWLELLLESGYPCQKSRMRKRSGFLLITFSLFTLHLKRIRDFWQVISNSE